VRILRVRRLLAVRPAAPDPGRRRQELTGGPNPQSPAMSRFSIRYPYLVIVICLIVGVVGVTSVLRMPVDLFPPINIPVVVVATFYSGMPPEQIENDITGTYERFFTLASGIDHIESRSLPGISLIKIYFQPGTDADSDVTGITNLAMANLRRLPPGTLPPVVLKFDASSLPVCLITLKGEGLNQTQLHDVGQYNVRNQVAAVPGCAIPPPFGGKLRQIQIYLDPVKMEARQLSLMDVVRGVNDANLILPAGDVKIGPFDYNLYTKHGRRDQPAAAEDGPGLAGPRRGHRPGEGRRRHPDEHRADRRPALGVPAHPQVQRGGEHDRRREGHKGGGRPADRHPQVARGDGRL